MTGLFYRPLLIMMLSLGFTSLNIKTYKPHPLHVSTTDISYNTKDNKIETTCRVFIDDFELALQKQYNTKTDLQKPAMHEAMDVLVKSYLAAHLQVKANSLVTPLNYLGFEVDKEAVNIYLESEKTALPGCFSLSVTKSLAILKASLLVGLRFI